MKRNLRRLHIACAMVLTALAIGFFPTTSYADSSDYWPSYPGYGSSYGCVHVVHYGETMSGIAGSYGTSVYNLMQANGIRYPNYIYAGMSMAVPCGSIGYPYPMPYSNPYHVPYSNPYPMPYSNPYHALYSNQCVAAYHPVQFGETLSSIASRYGVNVNTLAYYNGLANPNLIYAGMTLIVPCSMGYAQQPYPAPVYPPQPYPAPTYPPPVYVTPVPMSTPPVTGQTLVVMQNIAFNPAALTIHVGQTVVWRNDDVAPHTTTSGTCSGGTCTPLAGWDSGTLNPGQSFSHQFTTTGTFPYYCRIHGAMMQGMIVVMQ